MHRLVVNTCRDIKVREKIRVTENLENIYANLASNVMDPLRVALTSDLRNELMHQISRLSLDQQSVFLLREGLGFSYEEISRLLHIPIGTAKSYAYRARESLCINLEGYVTT